MTALNDARKSQLVAQLSEICGEAHVLTSGDLSAWEQDWRKRVRGKALAVIRPGSTEQVSQAVRACTAAGVSIVPQGGNTGMVLGSVPDQSGTQVVMSLTRMRAIREVDAANLTVTVEAGCVLQALQEQARSAGFLFPLSLGAEGSCTIGGNLATNAGGVQVLRYGNARDLCLGLEVVTATGEVWNGLSGLRKDNTGYNLRDLFVGSEGTLGIITAATLKLFPLPVARLSAWAAVPSLQAALDLLNQARARLGADLTAFEVMGRPAIDLVAKHFPALRIPFSDQKTDCPYYVLIEISNGESEAIARERFESLLEGGFATECLIDAVVAQNLTDAHELWHVRESISLAQAEEGPNIKHDISLPISCIPSFVSRTDEILKKTYEGIRIINFGHLGDGNLHYNIQAPIRNNTADFLSKNEDAINAIVYASVRSAGGSISAEHGIGALKVDTLLANKPEAALNMMRAIKQAMDPAGTLNPGKVVVRGPSACSPPPA